LSLFRYAYGLKPPCFVGVSALVWNVAHFPPTRKGVVLLGRKVTAFSDLSGAEVPEDELGRLVIRSHPDLDGPAVYLEALPAELAALDKVNVPMVTVDWQPPGDGEAKTVTMTVADFDKLAKSGSTSKLLADAPRASGRRSSGGEEINYATLEHAGRPHRGRISPEEQAFVRDNLEAVNERLRAEGKRLIDPSNKEHKEQYGL
jgi:hypothetical protein